jgi:hypothetical protein
MKKAAENPIIQSGSGHGDLLEDKAGRLFYVLHTHSSLQEARPRKTASWRPNLRRSSQARPASSFIQIHSGCFSTNSRSKFRLIKEGVHG